MATAGGSAFEEENDPSNGPPGAVPQPLYDPYFSANVKIIQDLLLDEKRYHSTPGYCIGQPIGVAKWMRRTLLNWLRDIYRYRNADAGILSHAAQLTDRYMHVVPTDGHEYQLVGGTCFLIASKLNDALPTTAVDMAHYMADSAKPTDIRAKEMTICISLQWDLTCITPVDFVLPVIDFLEFVPSLKKIIRQSALNIYIKAFHVEDLNLYLPSYLAAACILHALKLTVPPELNAVALESVTRIQQLLELEARKIREVYEVLQSCFEPGTVQLAKSVLDADQCPQSTPSEPPARTQYQNTRTYASVVSSSHTPLPLATSTQLNSRRVNESYSLSSYGTGSSASDYTQHASSLSVGSTSSSDPQISAFTELENERPQSIHARHSLPPMQNMSAAQLGRYTSYAGHPNVHAAGQTLNTELRSPSWEITVASAVDRSVSASDPYSLKSTTAYMSDPRLLVLTGLPMNAQRRWTPADIRDVHLE
ncbi:G1/S-specific cyclin-D2 [Fasciola hepatica]|uniref:G1/S-specific cyclin-D2 n=1 Tax=Fasciola hepatica TaxID=6192 RepID=A0A4E0R7G8_FASHE|nr:G1/S-specific cyclin-D2 [Fasciola hepatica]